MSESFAENTNVLSAGVRTAMAKRVISLILFLGTLSTTTAETRPQRILLVHSFGREFAPLAAVVEGFRSELSRSHPGPVEFIETSLEMARFDGADREAPLVTFLSTYLAESTPDLVVAFGAPALDFARRNRAKLFPDVPVLVAGAEKRRVGLPLSEPWLLSVHTEWELPTIVHDIRSLLPALRHLYVVSGSAPVDRFWDAEAKANWPEELPGVTIHWMGGLSLAEMEAELADAPEHSAVFYGIMTRDAAGILQEYEEALVLLRRSTAAPIFGYSMEQLGRGIVGGRLISMRECGLRAAHVAHRILEGEDPADIPHVAVTPEIPTFDWRELQKWDIPMSQLPQKRRILYRPPSLWESHRGTVLWTTAALVLLGAAVITLAEARRRARESETRLRNTAEAAHVGWWEAGAMGHEILKVSSEWRMMFGFSKDEEITTEKTLDRIHPDDVEMVRGMIKNTMTHGEELEMEYRVRHDDGAIHWLATRGRAEPVNGGRRRRMRGVTLDITGRKRAEQELTLRRDELAHLGRVAALGELSGAFAHELNQPLGSIMSNAQTAQRLLAKDSCDVSMLREILADIVAEDKRAADIIQRLRALLERGETEFRPFDLHDGIEKALSLMQASFKASGVTVTRKFAESLPHVMADPVQIQQVVLNLLTNAADAVTALADSDRHVTIRTFANDEHVAVEVEDHGGGFDLPPELCFQPFQTTKRGGLGMGLAICRSIIEAHQGTILALPSPASGAIIRLTIPTSPLP